MTQLLFVLPVLVMVMIGTLIAAQVLSLEQLGSSIWRAFVLIAIVFVTAWFLKAVVLPILVCTLVLLRHAMVVFLMLVVAAAVVLLCWRLLKSGNRNTGNHAKTEE